MARRKLLEESPIPSTNEEPVLFDTSEIPWWAWVRRFHLPEVRRGWGWGWGEVFFCQNGAHGCGGLGCGVQNMGLERRDGDASALWIEVWW
jgi:hypothetical protein